MYLPCSSIGARDVALYYLPNKQHNISKKKSALDKRHLLVKPLASVASWWIKKGPACRSLVPLLTAANWMFCNKKRTITNSSLQTELGHEIEFFSWLLKMMKRTKGFFFHTKRNNRDCLGRWFDFKVDPKRISATILEHFKVAINFMPSFMDI